MGTMSSARPSAVLWDMDGTIVDTEPYWINAETALIQSYGGSWSHEEAMQLVGQGLWHSARIIRSRGVDLSEDQIIATLTDRVLDQVRLRVPWRPGALELLRSVEEAGMRNALVTMSMRRMAEHIAGAAGGAFEIIVAGDDVTHSKPHPEPYERAAELLGLSPADCVAIEDSNPGVASATAAGAVTIAVPHVVPIESSAHYTVWPTLDGRTAHDLVELFVERSAA